MDTRSTEIGVAILRISLGVMFLAHSLILKVFIFTLPGTAQFFGSIGLPPVLAYIVAFSEIIAGIMLITGVWGRWAAAAMIPILLGAVWAHSGNGWLFTNQGGGWEYPFYLTILAFVQWLLGDGTWALRPAPGLFPWATGAVTRSA